jgi:hypothetical protein
MPKLKEINVMSSKILLYSAFFLEEKVPELLNITDSSCCEGGGVDLIIRLF